MVIHHLHTKGRSEGYYWEVHLVWDKIILLGKFCNFNINPIEKFRIDPFLQNKISFHGKISLNGSVREFSTQYAFPNFFILKKNTILFQMVLCGTTSHVDVELWFLPQHVSNSLDYPLTFSNF